MNNSPLTFAPVDPSPLRQILLCDLYHRPAGFTGTAYSPPGHLIQLTTHGQAEHEVEGRRYLLEPGSVLWYHEVEHVKVRVLDEPWSFYTLNFIAQTLEPPSFEQRVKNVRGKTQQCFDSLLTIWRQTDAAPTLRRLRVHAKMNDLLAELLANFDLTRSQNFAMNDAARLWWEAENQLRQHLNKPITLTELARSTGRSPATLARACHAAVNLPPMKRLKQIRMNLARGLVRQSNLHIQEIACRVGYQRPHEFSRDYRRYFGQSPRNDRSAINQS